MFKVPGESPFASGAAPDFLGQAAAILSRELSVLPPFPSALPVPQQPADMLTSLAGNAVPRTATGSMPSVAGAPGIAPPEWDRIRQQANELIQSLVATFGRDAGEQGAPFQGQVPLLHGAAPVQAGGEAIAEMRVSNEESSPVEVSLYCSNFIADSGHEIPALRVSILPRSATVPPKGEASFEVRVAIPQQAAPGTYSGLIQAAGSKYLKAVLMVEVL